MIGPHRLPCETPDAHPSKNTSVPTRWILPTAILGSSLGFIDGSVVNVALPEIAAGLDAGFAAVQWVVNGYMLALASLILLGGSSGDRFGQRRVFMIGLVGFAAASLGCALATSAGWLITARFAQGAAAALITPASLAIIGTSFAGEARGSAIGTWAAAGALTTALGPPLGGWLVDSQGWRSIFYINLPIAAAALLLAAKLPEDSETTTTTPLDVPGAGLTIAALGLMSYGLIALSEGNRVAGAIAATAAVFAACMFLLTEARSKAPMVPGSLFRVRAFAGANGLTVLLYAALSAALFLLPFMLIEVHGYTAAAAGAAFLPFSAIMGAGSRWAGSLAQRVGARIPMILGPALAAAGYVLLALFSGSENYWTGFLPGLVVVASGMTLCIAPLTTTVLDAAPASKGGTASGINNAAARVGGLAAIAALGFIFGGSDFGTVDVRTLTEAYRWVMYSAAALALLSAAIAAVTIGAPDMAK